MVEAPQFHPERKESASSPFEAVQISEFVGIPQVIAGFIFEKLGLLGYEYQPVVTRKTRVPDELKGKNISLLDKDEVNPVKLYSQVAQSNLDAPTKIFLKRLIIHTEHYRELADKNWWQAGVNLPEGKVNHKGLFQYLACTLAKNLDLPTVAYQEAIGALEELLQAGDSRFTTAPEIAEAEISYVDLYSEPPRLSVVENVSWSVTVPMLKSKYDELDVTESAQFDFNLANLKLLKDQHFAIVVGGSRHSGKSTLSVSLALACRQLVEQASQKGVISRKDVRIGLYDLDIFAPTARYIAKGQSAVGGQDIDPFQERSRAAVSFSRARSLFNLVIGDLPGKISDFTEFLARPADFSIVVEGNWHDSAKDWQKFLSGVNLPTHIAGVHTRYHEPGRVNGVRFYKSHKRQESEDFLQARAVDLDLVPQPDNVVIKFLAEVLLLDYLPRTVSERDIYRYNINQALRLAR